MFSWVASYLSCLECVFLTLPGRRWKGEVPSNDKSYWVEDVQWYIPAHFLGYSYYIDVRFTSSITQQNGLSTQWLFKLYEMNDLVIDHVVEFQNYIISWAKNDTRAAVIYPECAPAYTHDIAIVPLL